MSPASLKGFDHEEWFTTFRPSTVEAHLREAAAWSRSSGHEFIDWRIEGIGIDLRGLLSEGNLPEWMGSIVATLRQAAAIGGVGKAVFFGLAQPVAFELMASKKAKWRELTGPSIAGAGEQRIVAITRLSRALALETQVPRYRPRRSPCWRWRSTSSSTTTGAIAGFSPSSSGCAARRSARWDGPYPVRYSEPDAQDERRARAHHRGGVRPRRDQRRLAGGRCSTEIWTATKLLSASNQEEIADAEKTIGQPLPNILRRLYGVANGGGIEQHTDEDRNEQGVRPQARKASPTRALVATSRHARSRVDEDLDIRSRFE